jgi:serine/threonine protein kinase
MALRALFLALFGAVICACAVGASAGPGAARGTAGPEQRLAVPRWSASLPGASEPLEVTMPVHLEARLPRAPVEYGLRARVDVPEAMRGRALTLTIPYMTARATLRADGAEALPIEASALDRYRATNPPRWRIPAAASADGRLDLELTLAHRSSRTAWIDSVPVLTTDPLGGGWTGAVYAFNAWAAELALAGALIVAILYGFLWASLRDRRREAHGWFALGAACGMVYPAFGLGLTQPLFGVYEAPVMTVSLVLGSLAAMHFARAYVNQPPPSRAWWAVFGVVVALAIALHDPFVSLLVLGPAFLAVTFANAFAQLVFLARLRQRGQRPSLDVYLITFAWPLAVVLGLPDVLAWLGQGEPAFGIRTACLGILAISLYQGAALSRELLLSLRHADELNAELGERVKLLQAKHREVELLNDELRRQIAARSRELAEKLAQMDDDELCDPPALQPGDVVEARYAVVKALGTGGMGTVYEVERVTDGRHLALKALVSGGDAQQRARFAREAQIVANVSHPNVVSIVDVDVAKSGFIFLVMELVEGGTTLHAVRKRHRDVAWTLGVLAQVAEGIHAIHGAGIIHRDLKPGNILLSRGADGRRPQVKITDFGISALQPEGGRASSASMARARPVMDSLPPASELPLRAPLEGIPAIKVTELEAALAGAPPGGAKDPTGTMLIDLDVDPEAVADTVADVGGPEREDSGEVRTVAEGAVRRGSDRPPAEERAPERAALERAADRRAERSPDSSGSGKRAGGKTTPRAPSSPLTETGLIFGTPQYMAAELAAGTKQATRAADVFALGIIAFELLTGRRPFAEAPVSAKLHGRPLPEAPSFRQMCPTLAPEIAGLLDRAMSHDPRARPSAKDLAAALRASADRLSA